MIQSVVELVRGTVVESWHRVHVAVVDGGGRLRASAGDPDLGTFFRSAAKPFQAIPIVQDGAFDRFGLTDEELALCCGSHSGQARHLEVAESILGKIGMGSEALHCGPHPPFHEPSRRDLVDAGMEPVRLHNNCSGKHAGMMALARVHGWSPAGYERLGHPVQNRILNEIGYWSGIPADGIALGTDGCGVVTFALPLRAMALSFARLAAAARNGEPSPQKVVDAMTAFPWMVAGDGRLCTDLMRCSKGRLFAKLGAEGVYCVGVPGAELGIALKIEDGGWRALGPAVVDVLRQLDLISEDDLGELTAYAFPEVVNTCGEVVGQLRSRIDLAASDA
jgi:L-asparaginase II